VIAGDADGVAIMPCATAEQAIAGARMHQNPGRTGESNDRNATSQRVLRDPVHVPGRGRRASVLFAQVADPITHKLMTVAEAVERFVHDGERGGAGHRMEQRHARLALQGGRHGRAIPAGSQPAGYGHDEVQRREGDHVPIHGAKAEIARASKRLVIPTERLVTTDEIRKDPTKTMAPYWLVDAVCHMPAIESVLLDRKDLTSAGARGAGGFGYWNGVMAWWAVAGSNRGPPACKAGALTG
jgi:hypothetical protein